MRANADMLVISNLFGTIGNVFFLEESDDSKPENNGHF